MTLPALESDFQRYVRDKAGEMPSRVVGDGRGDAHARLGVYEFAYRARLVEVLGSDFPGVQALAGDARFRELGAAYVDAHPSTHFNARWFGAHFAEFLAAQDAALGQMARLEWAMTLAFDAADEPVAGIEAAAAIPPEQWGGMQIVTVGALQRLDLDWNVGEIRQAADRGTTAPALERLARPEAWLVWRKDFEVYTRALAADEARALDAARAGQAFGEVCEALSAGDDAPMRAAALLRRWLDDGMVRTLQG